MSASRKTARIAGLWFIGTFVFSIPALLLYDPLLNDAGYILGSGFDTRISLGALLEVLLAIANIATAVVLFPLLRRVHEAVSLGYVALRVMESAIIVTGLISLMSVVTLRNELGGSADPATLEVAGRTLVAVHDWTFLLGPQFCAGFGNGLLLGYLLYRSGLVPRRVALVGLVGGPLAFSGGVLALFGVLDQPSAGLFLLTIPEIVWEAFLGISMTFWGFRTAPVAEEYDRAALGG